VHDNALLAGTERQLSTRGVRLARSRTRRVATCFHARVLKSAADGLYRRVNEAEPQRLLLDPRGMVEAVSGGTRCPIATSTSPRSRCRGSS